MLASNNQVDKKIMYLISGYIRKIELSYNESYYTMSNDIKQICISYYRIFEWFVNYHTYEKRFEFLQDRVKMDAQCVINPISAVNFIIDPNCNGKLLWILEIHEILLVTDWLKFGYILDSGWRISSEDFF